MSNDPHRIANIEELRAVIGEPGEGTELKVYEAMPPEAIAFIALAPILVLATSDAAGRADASPKGDAAGFVRIEDDRTLVIPDRPGNRLAYGLQNILATGRAGALFIVPGTTETLRVNGTAELSNDPALLDQLAARNKPATLAIRLHVEECFFHCSKAFLRSELWKSGSWPERQRISFGAMAARRLVVDDEAAAANLTSVIDTMIEEDYRTNL